MMGARDGRPIKTGYTMQTVNKRLFGYRLWYLCNRHPPNYPLDGFKKVIGKFYWKVKEKDCV
jgi:hypothetical protein